MRKNKQLILDYRKFLNSEAGQNILKDLRRKCPLFDDAIDASKGIDVYKLCYLQGQRDILLYIFKMMDTDPYEEKQRRAIQEGERNDQV